MKPQNSYSEIEQEFKRIQIELKKNDEFVQKLIQNDTSYSLELLLIHPNNIYIINNVSSEEILLLKRPILAEIFNTTISEIISTIDFLKDYFGEGIRFQYNCFSNP